MLQVWCAASLTHLLPTSPLSLGQCRRPPTVLQPVHQRATWSFHVSSVVSLWRRLLSSTIRYVTKHVRQTVKNDATSDSTTLKYCTKKMNYWQKNIIQVCLLQRFPHYKLENQPFGIISEYVIINVGKLLKREKNPNTFIIVYQLLCLYFFMYYIQDKCDMRPQAAHPLNNITKASVKSDPTKDAFGRMSPDFQRRIKHQGNVQILFLYKNC